MYIYIHTRIHAYIHTYKHTYIQTSREVGTSKPCISQETDARIIKILEEDLYGCRKNLETALDDAKRARNELETTKSSHTKSEKDFADLRRRVAELERLVERSKRDVAAFQKEAEELQKSTSDAMRGIPHIHTYIHTYIHTGQKERLLRFKRRQRSCRRALRMH